MAISGVTTNYSGRKRDIHILSGVNPYVVDGTIVTPKFGKVSAYCAGVQKLVQRYVILLMTEMGTQTEFDTFGTDFMTEAGRGHRGVTKADIQHMFNFANAKLIPEIRDYQSEHSDDPTDEQLKAATLVDCGVLADTLWINVKIETIAGDTILFVLPLPKV